VHHYSLVFSINNINRILNREYAGDSDLVERMRTLRQNCFFFEAFSH